MGLFTGQHFGDALHYMRNGRKTTRAAFGDQWLELQVPDSNSKMGIPYIFLTQSDGKRVPWTPTQIDMLAWDWKEVE